MQKFSNPLNEIKIASPCSANWDEMIGSDRKRYCAECKLNVYNLSDMALQEAENFLINSEGRVCVKFYRRKDGTVLTNDCPVGWQAVKRKVSRLSKAVFASFIGIFGGIFTFNQIQLEPLNIQNEVTVEFEDKLLEPNIVVEGGISNLENIKEKIKDKSNKTKNAQDVVGRYEKIRRLEDEPVVLWIE